MSKTSQSCAARGLRYNLVSAINEPLGMNNNHGTWTQLILLATACNKALNRSLTLPQDSKNATRLWNPLAQRYGLK